jgi:hypothetical protein
MTRQCRYWRRHRQDQDGATKIFSVAFEQVEAKEARLATMEK